MLEQKEYSTNAIHFRVFTTTAAHDYVTFICPECMAQEEFNNELPSKCPRCGARFDWFVKVSYFKEKCE